jgi:glycosyltransferase involved in cell wall biosynthesis
VIGGDGPLMTENKEYIIKNSLIDRVKIPGFIKDSFSILNVFDIFILPSLHEGIPMVLLEALSLGKPVIASNVGGIPEVVTHAIEALLIEPGRVGSIVNGCLTLLGSPELRKKIAANGKLKIEKHFNALEKSSDLINIYRKVNK